MHGVIQTIISKLYPLTFQQVEALIDRYVSYTIDKVDAASYPTENFYRQRAGMKASLKGAQTLANYQESRIRHLHATLDWYLNN